MKQADGEYQEELADAWLAEYDNNGFWKATIYQPDVEERCASDYASMEDAVEAAHEYCAQVRG